MQTAGILPVTVSDNCLYCQIKITSLKEIRRNKYVLFSPFVVLRYCIINKISFTMAMTIILIFNLSHAKNVFLFWHWSLPKKLVLQLDMITLLKNRHHKSKLICPIVWAITVFKKNFNPKFNTGIMAISSALVIPICNTVKYSTLQYSVLQMGITKGL